MSNRLGVDVSLAWRAEYSALQARETSTPNRFDIYAATTVRCPGATTIGWTRLAQSVAGPIRFTTSLNEQQAKPGDVLGLCSANGSVVHYRGSIEVVNDSTNTQSGRQRRARRELPARRGLARGVDELG